MSILRMLSHEGRWPESPYFPVVTLCDFPVRTMNQVQQHTVQCTLPLNFYHERMFVVLWVWFALLLLLNTLSLIYWLSWFILVFVIRRRWFNRKNSKEEDKRSKNNSTTTLLSNTVGSEEDEVLPTPEDKPLLGAFEVEIGGRVDKKMMLDVYRNPNMIFIYELIRSNVGSFVCKAFAEAMVVRVSRARRQLGEEGKGGSKQD